MNAYDRLRWAAGAAGLAVAVLGSACSQTPKTANTRAAGDEAAAPPIAERGTHTALVRMVHAIPSEASVEVLTGDQVTFPDVAYRAVTEYRELPAQQTTFVLRPAGPGAASTLAETTEALDAGKHYTLVAMPGDERRPAVLSVISDELAPPDEGKAKLRVVNASPTASEIDVRLGGAERALVSANPGAPASGYSDIAPVDGPLDVRRANRILVRVPKARLEAGRLYTLLVMQSSSVQPGRLEAWVIDESVALQRTT
jgi:Domain of unknown function (DUF4397)